MRFERQIIGVGDIFSVFYSLPIAVFGLVWLILSTDIQVFTSHWYLLLLFFTLIALFDRFSFYFITEIRSNRYGSSSGSLVGVIVWSALFLYGPTVLWLPILLELIKFGIQFPKTRSKTNLWSNLRNFLFMLAGNTAVPLTSLTIYILLGGNFPLATLNLETLIITMTVLLVNMLLSSALLSGFMLYNAWVQKTLTQSSRMREIYTFFLLAMSLPDLAHPFAIIGTYLFSQNGILIFMFFVSGMLVVAFLARQLSWAAESNRQKSRILERIEILGRSIINVPPGEDRLAYLLEEHIPNMFPAGRQLIWLFPDNILYKYPDYWVPDIDEIWPWLLGKESSQPFISRDPLPWKEQHEEHDPIILCPIKDMDTGNNIGGILIELHRLAQPWDRSALSQLCPAVQTLSAHLSSSLNQARVYQQALDLERVSEELRLASEIQSSLLPRSIPDLPGWQLAFTLHPAMETSGDFIDIIPMDDGRVGIVIADVMDKGIGPAIYMTLSRTLIRTFAIEFDARPDIVFYAVNERILQDTTANLFVTAFYGVLNTQTGKLTYANAGHNPPYLFKASNDREPISLTRTGIPIGIDETTWQSGSATIDPGDVLIMYTDGVPDSQNEKEEFYYESNLVSVVKENLDSSAEAIQQAILKSLYGFIGEQHQLDDITLMIIARDRNEPQENNES